MPLPASSMCARSALMLSPQPRTREVANTGIAFNLPGLVPSKPVAAAAAVQPAATPPPSQEALRTAPTSPPPPPAPTRTEEHRSFPRQLLPLEQPRNIQATSPGSARKRAREASPDLYLRRQPDSNLGSQKDGNTGSQSERSLGSQQRNLESQKRSLENQKEGNSASQQERHSVSQQERQSVSQPVHNPNSQQERYSGSQPVRNMGSQKERYSGSQQQQARLRKLGSVDALEERLAERRRGAAARKVADKGFTFEGIKQLVEPVKKRRVSPPKAPDGMRVGEGEAGKVNESRMDTNPHTNEDAMDLDLENDAGRDRPHLEQVGEREKRHEYKHGNDEGVEVGDEAEVEEAKPTFRKPIPDPADGVPETELDEEEEEKEEEEEEAEEEEEEQYEAPPVTISSPEQPLVPELPEPEPAETPPRRTSQPKVKKLPPPKVTAEEEREAQEAERADLLQAEEERMEATRTRKLKEAKALARTNARAEASAAKAAADQARKDKARARVQGRTRPPPVEPEPEQVGGEDDDDDDVEVEAVARRPPTHPKNKRRPAAPLPGDEEEADEDVEDEAGDEEETEKGAAKRGSGIPITVYRLTKSKGGMALRPVIALASRPSRPPW